MDTVQLFNKCKKDWTPPNLLMKRGHEHHDLRLKNSNANAKEETENDSITTGN
jgi:hypothetical protein